MSKIYIPTEYLDSPCKVVNNGYIRAYTNNNLTEYVDIFVNQDYMLKKGYSNYSYNGYCDNINNYTDDFYYRTDLSNILLNVFIIALFGLYLPYKIFMKLFNRRLI